MFLYGLSAHFYIQLYQFTFRDPISDLVVTADYDLIEMLYNFLRNGFQPDRNEISSEMKLRLMPSKGEKKNVRSKRKEKKNKIKISS